MKKKVYSSAHSLVILIFLESCFFLSLMISAAYDPYGPPSHVKYLEKNDIATTSTQEGSFWHHLSLLMFDFNE